MKRSIGRRVVIRRLLAAWSVAVLLVAISLSTAAAHAVPVRSEPSDGETVAQAPREIRIWFSEPILPRATQARVLDADGQAVPSTQVSTDAVDPTRLVLVVPELSDGIYNVAYSTLSVADGHATQGHLVFRVGAGAATEAGLAVSQQPTVLPAEAILRWLNFLALAALAGAIAVAFLLLRPGAQHGTVAAESFAAGGEVAGTLRRAQTRVLYWALVAALAAVVSGTALLLWQAWVLALPGDAGAGASKSTLEQTAWLVLHTQLGLLWVLRQILLLSIATLLAIWLGKPGRVAGDRSAGRHSLPQGAGAILGLLSVAVLTIQSKSGHAAAVTPGTTLSVLADSAHLIAASLWVGGLLALAIGLLPSVLAGRGRPMAASLARAGWGPFGLMAALSVGVLIVTGLYSTGREVASLDALLTTLYGRTLIVKMALVLVVGAFGMLNAAMLHPGLAAPLARLLRRPPGWTPLSLQRLPVLIMAELAGAILVLLATGVLASSPTANGPEFAPPQPEALPVTVPSQLIDDLLVTFEAKPNTPGQNIMLMQVASMRRPAPAEIMRVIVHFTFLGQDIGTAVADAQEISPGLYQLAGNQLSLAGPWQIDVVVRRRGIEDSKARFQWTVPPPVVPRRPVVVSNRPLEPLLSPLAAILLACLAACAAAATVGRVRAPLGIRFSKQQDQREAKFR